MKVPPYNDRIAVLLRDHFQTEESDAGLRSPSLEGQPKSYSTPDAAAVARASGDRYDKHRRCRDALNELAPTERNVLSLAYGVVFRSRDVDDFSGRKAPKKLDRNWRVRLRETFRDLGDVVAVVMALPFVLQNAKTDAKDNVIEWLLSDIAKRNRQQIQDDAIEILSSARKAFAEVYIPPEGEERLDAPKKRGRGRPRTDDDFRFRLLGGIHGKEIGR